MPSETRVPASSSLVLSEADFDAQEINAADTESLGALVAPMGDPFDSGGSDERSLLSSVPSTVVS